MARAVNRTSGKDADLDLVTDVLVIGGGPAGIWASFAAIEDGCRVVIVEKGYLGTSGPFGIGANTGIDYAMPGDERQRYVTVHAREPIAFGLSDPAWGYKVFDQSYANLDAMSKWGFAWPRAASGKEHRGSLRGPTILHFLRGVLESKGAVILDHSPALELLVSGDTVAGARGVNHQKGGTWQVRAGAVIVATGGTTFLSGVAGDKTHTGDGYLLAAEAGADFSGMEFSSQYHAGPAETNLTRGAFRSGVGTYYDNNGQPTQEGRKMVQSILETGAVWDQLDKTNDPVTQDLMQKTHAMCFQYFQRKGINPFTTRYPVSFILEGTIRAGGGIATDDAFRTSVSGLFAAGDVASKERLVGAGPPGGGPATAWAFATGSFVGHSAAGFVKKFARNVVGRKVEAIGQAGLRPSKKREDILAADVIKTVQGEMLPLQKNYWRNGSSIRASIATFDSLWKDVRESLGAVEHNEPKARAKAVLKAREAASLLAAGRWIYSSANERTETRGLHRRSDFPELDETQDGQHVITGGLDQVWVGRREHTRSIPERLAS